MPAVPEGAPAQQYAERAPLPPDQVGTEDTFTDVAAAAERSANVAGNVWSHVSRPLHEKPAEAGFDPSMHVPAGYEPYAPRFAEDYNLDDVEVTRQRIDQELADKRVLERNPKSGFALASAAGLTDPITLASMALPVGGETRIAQAIRTAAIAGGATAAEELVQQSQMETRSIRESLFNVGASSFLGGLVGLALRPHISAERADELLGQLDEVAPRRTLYSLAPPKPVHDEAHALLSDVNNRIAAREASLQNIVTAGGPTAEEATVAEREAREAKLERDQHAAFLMHDKDQQIAAELASDRYGVKTPAEVPPEGQGYLRRATREATEAVEAQRTAAQQKAEELTARIAQREAVSESFAKFRSAETDLAQHRYDVRSATSLEELIDALPASASRDLRRRLENLPIPKYTLLPESGVRDAPTSTPVAIGEEPHTGGSTVGAAAKPETSLEQERVAKGARTLLEGPIGAITPIGKIMGSPSRMAKIIAQHLANIPETLTKHWEGITGIQPIERNLWGQDGAWMQALKERKGLYKDYLTRMREGGNGAQAMSKREFREAVSMSMRRGDKADAPEVAKAAQRTRALVFEPLYQRAKATGMLPTEAKLYAESYLMRQFDHAKIRANMTEWLNMLTDHFAQGEATDPNRMTRAEASDIAHSVTRNIMGAEYGMMDWHALDGVVPQSARTKARELTLPDIKFEKFLNNDIDSVSHSYVRSLAPEVEMMERFGSRDMEGVREHAVEAPGTEFAPGLQDVRDEYQGMIEQARAKGDNAAIDKLNAQMASDLKMLRALRDRNYGIFGRPKDPGSFFVRAGRVLRSDNALRLLGAATLAHFPDLANTIMRFGMGNTFAAMAKLATNLDAIKLSRDQGQRIGYGLDMVMNATASMLGDYAAHSQYWEQRVMNRVTRGFTILTGETPLITAVQMLAGTLAQHEILNAAERVASGRELGQHLSAKLLGGGLDADMLREIHAEHLQFGRTVNGLKFGMSDQWANQKLAKAFESAVLRDAHAVTLRPGIGDTPLIMSTEIGKTLLQFKSFAFAANRAVVNPLAQGVAHGDPRAASALMALVAMGTLSYVAKQKAAGQPIEVDPKRIGGEILDKSNLLGWTGEVIFPALWQFGFKDLSRWSDRDPVETLGGPSLGTVASAYERHFPAKLFADTEAGEKGMSRSDEHFFRRLGPAQNLWYFRKHVNDFEDWIGNVFDLPGKSNADRAAERGE